MCLDPVKCAISSFLKQDVHDVEGRNGLVGFSADKGKKSIFTYLAGTFLARFFPSFRAENEYKLLQGCLNSLEGLDDNLDLDQKNQAQRLIVNATNLAKHLNSSSLSNESSEIYDKCCAAYNAKIITPNLKKTPLTFAQLSNRQLITLNDAFRIGQQQTMEIQSTRINNRW